MKPGVTLYIPANGSFLHEMVYEKEKGEIKASFLHEMVYEKEKGKFLHEMVYEKEFFTFA